MNNCKVCNADNRDEIEELGLKALSGEFSWRAVGRALDWQNSASIKHHMESHYIEHELREVEDEMQVAINEAVKDLYTQMRVAPPEVKPLYAAAIRNLQGLKDTKPSQQHLIAALKTIQEMTGMRQEQRMMLAFAERMFGEQPTIIDVAPLDELEPASITGGE